MDDIERDKLVKAYNAVAFVKSIQNLPPDEFVLAVLDPNNPLDVYKRTLEKEKADRPPEYKFGDNYKKVAAFLNRLLPD